VTAYSDETAFHDRPRTPPVVWGLIAVNLAVAFLQLTLVSPTAVRTALGFQMSDLQGSWWSVGTYMFVHGGFWHLALNMWTLWLFGPRVAATQRPGQFLGYYLLCGLGGWFFHVLFTPQGLLIGASAAVMGVLVAYAARWPHEQLLLFGVIPMTVRWLVAILVLVNILGGVSGDTGAGVAYLAHLGGLATGWVMLRVAGAVSLDGLRPRVAPVPDAPDDIATRAVPHRYPQSRSPREQRGEIDEIVAQSQAALAEQVAAPRPSEPPPSRAVARPAVNTALNQVLDKISAHGLDALTRAERQVLEDEARRLREG
jgi:membrane associated rhomboid family serine protease